MVFRCMYKIVALCFFYKTFFWILSVNLQNNFSHVCIYEAYLHISNLITQMSKFRPIEFKFNITIRLIIVGSLF